MKEWTESSLLMKMDKINHSDPNRYSEPTQILGRFIVTLRLLKIWTEPILMEHVSPCVWVPCTNYLIYRQLMLPVDLEDFT
jgi:hypothetical protein